LKKVIENRFSEIPVFIKYTEEFSKWNTICFKESEKSLSLLFFIK
jgi:hypothetical protein